MVLSPFGAFAINLAAITAAICCSPQAHEDPARRYRAAIVAGLFYLVLGLLGTSVALLFAALPSELVVALAGLALLATIGNALATATADERWREPALATFLVTLSGITLFSIGAAFWGAGRRRGGRLDPVRLGSADGSGRRYRRTASPRVSISRLAQAKIGHRMDQVEDLEVVSPACTRASTSAG